MKKQKVQNVLGVLLEGWEKKRTKTKNEIDLTRLAKNYFEEKKRDDETEIREIFQEFFKKKLDEEFQYFSESNNKLKKAIPAIKNLLLKDAYSRFFKIQEAISSTKQYIELKEVAFFNEIYEKPFGIISEKIDFNQWINIYLYPIHITLTLLLDTDSRNKELEKLGTNNEERKEHKRGRPFNEGYETIFKLVPIYIEILEEKYGKRKRGKSGVTTAIKKLCNLFEIHFKPSSVSSYYNYKSKKSKVILLSKIH